MKASSKEKTKQIHPSISLTVCLWLTVLALEWEKDLFSPLRCFFDEDDDKEVEAGIVRVEGRVFGTVEVFPSWLRELHSLFLRGRPTGSSDSGDSRGGNSLSSRLRGCFFKELGRKNRKHVKGLCLCTCKTLQDLVQANKFVVFTIFLKTKSYQVQVQVQVELYCHSATCGGMQWNEMSCLTGPRCYINTDIQHYKPIHN